MSVNPIPSLTEIEAARTPRGGWTRAQLAEWNVSWPPPKGWKQKLQGEVVFAQLDRQWLEAVERDRDVPCADCRRTMLPSEPQQPSRTRVWER